MGPKKLEEIILTDIVGESSWRRASRLWFLCFEQVQFSNLAKFGWRLITKLNILCAKVIKGLYFSNGDFFLMQLLDQTLFGNGEAY